MKDEEDFDLTRKCFDVLGFTELEKVVHYENYLLNENRMKF